MCVCVTACVIYVCVYCMHNYIYIIILCNYYHTMYSEINTKNDAIGQMIKEAPIGVRDVVINRPTRENNFGFVLLPNTGHQGYSIGMYTVYM